jgi:tight adherence protein B
MTANTRGGAWLGTLIEQSGVRTTPSKVILMSLGAAVFLGVLAAMLVRPTWLAPIIGAVGLVLPAAYLIRRRGVRMRKFEEMFPEALDLLSRAVKAGHAFQTAMNMAAEELPDPVGPEFRKTFDQQNFGLPLRDALNAMAVRIPIIDVKFFVTAVLIQRETGGNLSEILDNLSHVVRERFKVCGRYVCTPRMADSPGGCCSRCRRRWPWSWPISTPSTCSCCSRKRWDVRC